MPEQRPRLTSANGRRSFAHFPAAVLVYVVDDAGRVLLKWLFARAVELHRLWRDTDHPLQPTPTPTQQIDLL